MSRLKSIRFEAGNGEIRFEAPPQMTAEEVQALVLKRQVNALDIPEQTASRMIGFYPAMSDLEPGVLIPAGTRINWNGQLMRAAVDLWNAEENDPDNAPALWTGIAYKDGIRIAPETFTAENAAGMGEMMWFGGSVYRSLMDGNAYTPEEAPEAWERLKQD